MTGYLTRFAALRALIAKVFTSRNTERSTHMVELFPATARAAIKRPGSGQRDDEEPSRRSHLDSA